MTVKDRNGNPVEGLTARDFVVTEDGKPQDIAFVEFQRLPDVPAAPVGDQVAQAPVPAPAAAPAPVSEVASVTQGGFAPVAAGDSRFRDRRLLVLYFDLAAMPPGDQIRSYQAALRYIGSQMTPADLMALVTYEGGAVRIKQDFTGNKAQLQEAIAALIYGEDKDGDGVRDQTDQSTAFGQGDAEFNVFNTDRQLAAMQTAVTMLRPFPEQKALIYFGSGLRLNGTDNTAQLRATTNAAIRSNVTIHPVDARGLVATPPLGDATQRSPGGQAMFTGATAGAMIATFQRSQDALFSLAKDTGGTVTFDNNDLSEGIRRAAQSVTSYYMLGYYSTRTEADGKFRRVKVSLTGDRDVEITFRQGYYGDKTFAKLSGVERERQLEEALMLENPITEIPIAMEVNYFQLNRAEYFVPVAVKIPGSELALARRRGAQRTLIDFIGEVKDDFGVTIQNVRDKLDIKLSDQTAAELASRPIQDRDGLHAAPGEIRDQVPGARCRGRPHRHLPGIVYRAEPEPRGADAADQHRGAGQPARAARCRVAHGQEHHRRDDGRAPTGLRRAEADSQRDARLQRQPRHARLPAGVRARRHHHAAAGRLRVVLQGRREGVRDPADGGSGGAGPAVEGGAGEAVRAARRSAAGTLRMPGHCPRTDRAEGRVLARARRDRSLMIY